jgi:hypothetical protein
MESSLEFTSEEKFAHVCESLSLRPLHAANRIWLGESGFAWEVAELLNRLGRVFAQRLGDAETQAEFGDGYTPGNVPSDQRSEHLLQLLRPAPQ